MYQGIELYSSSMHGGYRIIDEFAQKVKESDLETQKKMFLAAYKNNTSFINENQKKAGKILESSEYRDELLVYPGDRDKENHNANIKTMYLAEVLKAQMSPEEFDKFILDSFTQSLSFSGISIYPGTFCFVCNDNFGPLGLMNSDESKIAAFQKMDAYINGENQVKKKLSVPVGDGLPEFLYTILPTLKSKELQESCAKQMVKTMPDRLEIPVRMLVRESLTPIDIQTPTPEKLMITAGEDMTPDKIAALLEGARRVNEYRKNVSWDYERGDVNAPRVDFEAEKNYFKNRNQQLAANASNPVSNSIPFELSPEHAAELARRQEAIAQSQQVATDPEDYGGASAGGFSK